MGTGEPFCQGSKILVLIKAEIVKVNHCYSKIDDKFEFFLQLE